MSPVDPKQPGWAYEARVLEQLVAVEEERDELRAEVERLRDELRIARWDADVPIRELREENERLREAGDALADAVTDIMADDPLSVLHTWTRKWWATRAVER